MEYENQNVYLFFRKDSFYPIYLKNNEEAKKDALNNPGTIRVEDIDGNIIWDFDKEKSEDE